MLTQIDHVGIAVSDLGEAVERYRRTFGIEPVYRERMDDQGVEEVLFAVGGIVRPAARSAGTRHAGRPVPG